MTLAKVAFWKSVGLLFWTHVGYPLALVGLRLLVARTSQDPGQKEETGILDVGAAPSVSLIVAAHDEEDVIASKVANALALDYPRERLELIVASDGSTDDTAAAAREAGADLVLELPRAGKLAAQDAAVERSGGEIVAFSDANSVWGPTALRELVLALADEGVGYACGRVDFAAPEAAAGTANEEGAYWRYEMAVRELESGLGGVTAGNGAIYAVRRVAYRPLPASRSHDLSLPFMLAKDGWRSVYVPAARAGEKLVPTVEGEFARKRRMMRGLWDIVVADRMIDPRGYRPLYAFQIFSHRVLRYLSPLLHLVALAASVVLAPAGVIYRIAFATQAGLLAAAALAGRARSRVLAIPRYYVLTTASIAAGLWDRFRDGPPAAWERSEGTR